MDIHKDGMRTSITLDSCTFNPIIEAMLLDVDYKIAYQSDFNKYVVYDYEPYDKKDFHIEYIIDNESNKIDFALYLIQRYIDAVNELEKMHELTYTGKESK